MAFQKQIVVVFAILALISVALCAPAADSSVAPAEGAASSSAAPAVGGGGLLSGLDGILPFSLPPLPFLSEGGDSAEGASAVPAASSAAPSA